MNTETTFAEAEAEVERLLALYAREPTREVFEAAIRAQRVRNAAREREARS